MSIGLSFHWRTGSTWRMTNRVRCSSRETENQNFVSESPEFTSIRSNSGASRMNSRYSSGVQKPITRSTPARLYQDRSNITISPDDGRWVTYRWKYHWVRSRSVGFSSRVPALEHDDQPLAGVLDPVLQLDQLDLQQSLGPFVVVARHPLVVRIVLAPGVYHGSVGPQQHRVVVIIVHDGQSSEDGEVRGILGPRGRYLFKHTTSTAYERGSVTAGDMCLPARRLPVPLPGIPNVAVRLS